MATPDAPPRTQDDLGLDPARLLAPCACFNARSAARAVTSLYDKTLEPTGLKITQFAILAVIRMHGAVTMQQLAAELGLDPSTMSRTLRPLESQDLVRTEPGADRRVKELVLTGPGQRQFRECQRLWQQAQDRLHDLIGDEVFQRLVGDLATVTSRITGEAQGEDESRVRTD